MEVQPKFDGFGQTSGRLAYANGFSTKYPMVARPEEAICGQMPICLIPTKKSLGSRPGEAGRVSR